MKMIDKKALVLSLILFLAVFIGLSQMGRAQEEANVPEGMELIKVGETKVLIPKGSKVYKKDALLILEPPEQYWTRRIVGLEEEIAALRAQEEKTKADIEELKQASNQTENASKK